MTIDLHASFINVDRLMLDWDDLQKTLLCLVASNNPGINHCPFGTPSLVPASPLLLDHIMS
jgi:hypothetical protein